MGRYTNRIIKYTFLLAVIVASIAFFRVHLNDKLTNALYSVSHLVYGAGGNNGDSPAPTITMGNPTYFSNGTEVSSDEAYSNKISRVRFELTTTNLEDQKDITYSVSKSNRNVSDKFDISVVKRNNGTGRYYLYVDFKNQEYSDGKYTVSVEINGYSGTAKSKNFTLLGKYYNMTLDNAYAVCYDEGKCSTGNGGLFNILFSNVEGIDANNINNFSLDNVEFVSYNVNDTKYKNKFHLNYSWGNEWRNYAKIQIKTDGPDYGEWFGRRYVEYEIPNGTYKLTISYSDPTYSTARGTLTFTAYITFTAAEVSLTKEQSYSNRLTRYPSSYDLVRYHDDVVTIKYASETNVREISKNEFVTNYSGVNLSDEKFDSEGYYLYSFGPEIYIKTITTEDGVEYVSYYTDPTDDNTLTKVTKTEFQNNYGAINVNSYKFANGHTVKIIDGFYREFDTVNKSIRSAGGGRFILNYSYSDDDNNIEDYFDTATVTITQRPDGADDYTTQVYSRRAVKTGYHSYDIVETGDDAFSFSWSIDENRNLITVIVVYDDVDDKYAGNYKIDFTFGNSLPFATYFKIDNAPEDFFLATSVEKHEDSGDPLGALFPPGNKRYEYYLSLRMLKGEIDPYTKYEAEGIQTAGAIKIFTKRADKRNNGDVYFYDQVDYTVIIDKYNATTKQVTYRYSEDQAESYLDKNYSDPITETINGHSNFETKFTDAFRMLNKYKFDSDGNINKLSDNIPNSIIKIETVNKIDYLTYITSGTTTARIEKEKYISTTGQQQTLVDSYQILDFDIDGNVNRGVINGSYKSQEYSYDSSYDVTDQFDIDVKTEQEYTIIIDYYKDNVVKYRYSEDEGKYYNEKNYVSKTETLNGSSLFETKYKDAYRLLDKYVFKSNGDIDKSKDNYRYSIARIYTENGVDMITHKANYGNTNTTKDTYLSYYNGENTYDIAMEYLDFDADGYINRGVIHGAYAATDIDHAVKILPKTEVPAGDYYVYVDYSPDRYGIGYLNNGVIGGVYDADEVVITPSKYPENWNRNIHMSSIRYTAPEYDISLDIPRFYNRVSDQRRMFYNVDSAAVYEITPKYIYNYDDIHYKVQYTLDDIPTDLTDDQIDALTWVDADPDDYTINFGTIDDQEKITPINSMEYNPDFDGQYVISIVTKAGIRPAKYRIVAEYTNPDNGISLIRKVFQVFDLTNKYYGLEPVEVDDNYFIHNYPGRITLRAVGSYITNPNNIELKMYYIQDGVRVYLDKGTQDFTLDGNKFFKYSVDISTNEEDDTGNSIVYSVNLENYTTAPDITYIGTYGLEISYAETGLEPAQIDIPFYVERDQYYVELLEGEEAHATPDELSFTKHIKTQYLTEEAITGIYFTLMYYNENYNDYVDVTNTSDQYKHLKRYDFSNIDCNHDEEGVCTADVTFVLNKNNVDLDGDYYLGLRFAIYSREYEITGFRQMFGWNIQSSSIKSTFNNYNGTNTSKEFDGFFRNSDSVKITGVINNRIHDYNVNYSVSQTCFKDTSGNYTTCNPTSNQYGDFFDVNQYGSGNYRYIELSPKKNNDGTYKIQPGTYQLILYYETSYFRVIEFDVHSVFASIEHSNVSIKSTYRDEEVDGLYKTLNGSVSVDVDIEGVDYTDVERLILDGRGARVHSFNMNSVNEFGDSHKTIITYNPNEETVNTGTYYYVTRYTAPDSDIIQEITPFEVYGEYFDFDISGISVNPTPLIVNTSGTITYHMTSKNIPNFLRDQYGDVSGGNIYKFATNAKMYDYQGNDVTSLFTFNIVKSVDTATTGNFDLEVSFRGNTLPVGSYKLETYFSSDGKTVSRYYWVVIDEADRFLEIQDVSIVSNTSDKVIHNSHGGSYIISYIANTEGSEDEIDVQVTSATTNVTNKFGINIANNQIVVTYTPMTDNLPEGDYNINITYGGRVDVVQVHLYGEFDPENPIITALPIESNNYEVIKDGVDNMIYINTLTTKQLRKAVFLSNLDNIHEGYKILDKNGNDVTNSANYVGTNYKLVNPEDGTYTIVLIGDVNQDGNISLADVGYIFQYVTSSASITDTHQLKAARVRKQNAITLADVGKLFQFATGVISSI